MKAEHISQQGKLNTSVPCVVICPGYHGHAVARSLGRIGISVYGVHEDPRSPAARSRYWKENFFWKISEASPEESVNWFLDLARKIGSKPILIPTDDHTCLFVDDNSEKLMQEYLFPKQPDKLARSLSDKEKLYYLCKEKSVLTPETVFPKSREDVVDFLKDASFPVMLKGVDTVALQKRVGIRMVIVEDSESLLKHYDEMESPESPNLMLQEYIAGDAKDVWMFDGYFDNESNCKFGITAKKLRQYPAYTGMASLGICEKNDTFLKIVKDLMKSIGYKGILDIGYKYNPLNGKYYLLDPNPRLGRTFRLFVDSSGMDVVQALYLDMTEQEIQLGSFVEGRKWFDETLDIVASFKYWRDDNLTLKEWITSFKNVKESQWFAKDDLKPFFNVWRYPLRILGLELKRLFSRS